MPADMRLYELLGVSPEASREEIRRAYRQLARQHHPDRGGDTSTFQAISAAHEVLSNDEQRRIYDRYGEPGLQQGADHSDGAEAVFEASNVFGDLFGSLFGDNSPFVQQPFGQRPKPASRNSTSAEVAFRLQATLMDVFSGATKHTVVRRTVCCSKCRGTGSSEPGLMVSCNTCRGQGRVQMMRRIGLGMIQQVSMMCQACQGSGRVIPRQYICPACSGEMIQREEVSLEVNILAGSADGHRIVLAGKGHHFLGQVPGNAVAVLQVVPHPQFIRKGDDILCEEVLPLAQALCGCSLTLEHLDGRRLLLRSPQGRVVKPGSVWRARGLGMPRFGTPRSRGDLLLSFKVDWPAQFGADDARELERTATLLSADDRCPRPGLWQRFLLRLGLSGMPALQNVQSTTYYSTEAHDAEYTLEEVMVQTAREPDQNQGPRSRL